MRAENAISITDCVDKLRDGDKLVKYASLGVRNPFLMQEVADEVGRNTTCEGLMLSGIRV